MPHASDEAPGDAPIGRPEVPPGGNGRAARPPRWLVFATFGALFLWLRLESNDIRSAALMGAWVAGMLGWVWAGRALGGRALIGRALRGRAAWLAAGLVGGAVGVGAAAASALLMLLKNGSHGHLFPDFPFGVIAAMLARAPAWGLGGILLALGVCILFGRRAIQRPQ